MKDVGMLVELSIFSYGWMGGLILVSSDDDWLMMIILNLLVGLFIYV